MLKHWRLGDSVGVLAVLLGLAFPAASCGGFAGELGNMTFQYSTDEFSGKQPLAVSSHIRVEAYVKESNGGSGADAGTSSDAGSSSGNSDSKPVSISSVRSGHSSTIEVQNVGTPSSNTFELVARSAGTTTIRVEGTAPSGAQIKDKFTLEAKKADRVKLEHLCSSDDTQDEPVYLADQKASVSHELKAGDQNLVGWGHYPVSVQGSQNASIDTSLQSAGLLSVSTGATPATLELKPEVGGSSLSLDVRKESAIDTLGWYVDSSGEPKLLTDPFEGKGALLYPRFEIGGREVCKGAVNLKLTNETPDVCAVTTETFGPGEGGTLLSASPVGTAIRVKGKKRKSCTFNVSVAAASKKVSTSVQLDLSSN